MFQKNLDLQQKLENVISKPGVCNSWIAQDFSDFEQNIIPLPFSTKCAQASGRDSALLVQSLKQPGPQLQIGLLSDIVMPTTVIKHWCNFA